MHCRKSILKEIFLLRTRWKELQKWTINIKKNKKFKHTEEKFDSLLPMYDNVPITAKLQEVNGWEMSLQFFPQGFRENHPPLAHRMMLTAHERSDDSLLTKCTKNLQKQHLVAAPLPCSCPNPLDTRTHKTFYCRRHYPAQAKQIHQIWPSSRLCCSVRTSGPSSLKRITHASGDKLQNEY